MGQEFLVGLLAQEGDLPFGQGGVVGEDLHVVEDIQLCHLPGDGGGVLGGQLGPVGPVDLVAVVLGGVVAGGDVQAGDAAVLPHGEGELRGGAHGLKQAHGDAVGGHDLGGPFGKLPGVQAAVVADGHPLGGGLGTLGQDDLGKGLGGVADHMEVHPPQAHPHDPPQAGGAELQHTEEAVLQLLGVTGDGHQLGPLLGRQGGGVEPLVVLLTIGHLEISFHWEEGPPPAGWRYLWYRVPALI